MCYKLIKLFIYVTIFTGVRHNGVLSDSTCVLPPFPDHGKYEVPDVPDASPGQSAKYYLLNVSCNEGYGVLGPDGLPLAAADEVFCVNGRWSKDMPKCVSFCKLNPDTSVGYFCYNDEKRRHQTCGKYMPPGSKVKAMCKSEFFSTAPLPDMNCVNGTFDYIPKCKPECGRSVFSQHEHPEDLSTPKSDGKIVLRGEVPWHVVIYLNYFPHCGGSIISNQAVLTAGSCLSKHQPLSDVVVAANKLFYNRYDARDLDAQMSKITEVKDFGVIGKDDFHTDHISILILETPFVYNLFVRPICINFNSDVIKQDLRENNKGKVTGIGQDAERQETVELVNINLDKCQNSAFPVLKPFYTKNMLCTGYYDKEFAVAFSLFAYHGGGLAFPHEDAGITRYYLAGPLLFLQDCVKKKCPAHFTMLTTFTNLSIYSDEVNQFL